MRRGFDAIEVVTIEAPLDRVWEALTSPDKVREYMHGTNLTTDWKVGSPIYWRGEWKGEQYEDKGEVLEIEPQTHLKYTHWSPMSGVADTPDNYHTVAVDLVADAGTTTLTLTQDNNATQEEADSMAKNNWGPMLVGLKETAER